MEGRLSRVLCASLFALAPGLAKADSVNAEWYSSTRTLSMGNIGIASADDAESATFQNPAGLARLRKMVIEPIDPQIEFGGGFFSNSGSLTDWSKVSSYDKMQPKLKEHPNVPSSDAFAIFPNVSSQNFSFGMLYSTGSSMYYESGGDAYHYHSRQLLVPTLGISAAGLGNRFRIGAAVRAVEIHETEKQNPASTTSLRPLINKIGDGFGIGLDAGAMITMPWGGLPTLGFVARNIGGTAFSSEQFYPVGGKAATRHDMVKMAYDAGLSFTGKSGKDQLVFAVDYRDALNTTNADLARHGNLGFEYGFNHQLFVRAGFSQGYWTAGFGLDAKGGSVDLGTYGEELTSGAYHGALDRRYSLRLTRRF